MILSDYLNTAKTTMDAYNSFCEPVLRKHNIPQVSFDILMFLHNNPGFSTAQEISDIRKIKKNLVSVHVEKLVQAGLLQRGTIPGDRRKVALSCTEKAAPIIDDGLRMQKAFFEELFDGITEEEWEIHKRINETLSHNIRKIVSSTKEIRLPGEDK